MKFLFVVSDFEIGGVTTSLRNLANTLIQHGHFVSIWNLPLIEKLPEGFDLRIHLIPFEPNYVNWNIGKTELQKTRGLKKIKLFIWGIFKKILQKTDLWYGYAFRHLTPLTGYDMAVAFRQGPICSYLVQKKVLGGLKLGFWHGDPNYMGNLAPWDKRYLPNFDYVGCVSNAIRDAMILRYPFLKGHAITIYNTFLPNEIKAKAKDFLPKYHKEDFNIVTVSRLEENPKNIRSIPVIAQKLKQLTQKSFCWYIIGDGPDREEIIQTIQNTNTYNNVKLLGAKQNPYPYIEHANLFVFTSRWESFGMVIIEALILGIPVVAGDYPALSEILESGKTGLRINNSIDDMVASIAQVLNDSDLYHKLKRNVLAYCYDHEIAYRQLMSCFQSH